MMDAKREIIEPRQAVGRAEAPNLEWISGKHGYLWVGDGEECLFTLTTAEARRLALMIQRCLGEVPRVG
jgi:hypothetical protein